VTTCGVSISFGGRDLRRTIDESLVFLNGFRHCTFTPVSVDAYLEAARRFHRRTDAVDRRFAEWFLPFIARFDAKRLRIVEASVLDGADGPHPAQAVTFANIHGAWIVIHVPMSQLTELQFFVLLHEIGHTTFASFTSRWLTTTNKRRILSVTPFLAATLAPTAAQAVALAALTVMWYLAAECEARESRDVARLVDELRADAFALERCPATWCERYTEAQLAGVLCRDDKYAFRTSAKYTELPSRADAFIANLRRLRAGQRVEVPAALRRVGVRAPLESVLAIAIATTCGLSLAPLSGWRLAFAAIATLFAVVWALLFVLIHLFHIDLLDDGFNVRTIDPRVLTVLQRAAEQRERLKRYGIISRADGSES
jgi:hypothetical protein